MCLCGTFLRPSMKSDKSENCEMNIEQIRSVHQASPFRPFTLHLADGQQVFVERREFLSRSPSGKTVIVHGSNESFKIFHLQEITQILVTIAPNATDCECDEGG